MEKKQYSPGKFIYFSDEEIKFVGKCIEEGKSAEEIAEIFSVGVPKVFKVIDQYLILASKKTSRLGYKDSSYFTEEQMLTSPIYTWTDLSEEEKNFYKSYGKKKKRKRHRSNDQTLE
jgi:hypothetical protein